MAYDPAILLEIVLLGYYKGLISSRRIACERNIQFKALTADSQPHFTTIANFVATMQREIVGVFRDVLVYADALGLVGKDTFAIDGCKLPSNASKKWSGTHEELRKKQQKYEAAVKEYVFRPMACEVASPYVRYIGAIRTSDIGYTRARHSLTSRWLIK